jgi:fermentation-respiration switch protein FrsA (DUF1100 family)
METSPVTCRTLEEFYHIDGHTFEKQYKEVLSGYRNWEQLSHAGEWMLFPENMGPYLAIDETSLSRLKQGKTTEDIPAILQGIFRPSAQPYLISWMQYDPREVIRQVKQPVLIVNGDNDIQISADNAEALAQARPDADKVIIEGMTHLLKQSEVTDPQRQKTTIYMDAAAPVSEKLVTVMADFIRRI